MTHDVISSEEKRAQLKDELCNHHKTKAFNECNSMGEIVRTNFELLLQKDFKQSIVFK